MWNDNRPFNPIYYRINNLDAWIHQNRAEYTGDFVDGCLLDSFVMATKRGYAAIYETYLNPNSSCYTMVFAPYKDSKAVSELWEDWYKFESKANAETA